MNMFQCSLCLKGDQGNKSDYIQYYTVAMESARNRLNVITRLVQIIKGMSDFSKFVKLHLNVIFQCDLVSAIYGIIYLLLISLVYLTCVYSAYPYTRKSVYQV